MVRRTASIPAILAATLFIPAPRAQTTQQVLAATGTSSGLCSHVGAGDGSLAAGLAQNGQVVVHGLVRDDGSLATARATLRSANVYGLASVEMVDTYANLPYADRLVNLLVADMDALGADAPQLDEIMRVLAPGGSAYLKRGGTWSATVKAADPVLDDDWCHWDRGADANAVSQMSCGKPHTQLRWHASPETSQDNSDKRCGVRLANGRFYYVFAKHDLESRVDDTKSHAIARDAHNGTFLWKREVSSFGYVPFRYSFVADGDALFAQMWPDSPMVKLDGATGNTLVTYAAGIVPKNTDAQGKELNKVEEFLMARVADDKLVQAYKNEIRVLDAASGTLLWKYTGPSADRWVSQMCVAEGKVFALETRSRPVEVRGSVAFPLGDIVAFDLGTGQQQWRCTSLSADNRFIYRLYYYKGLLPVAYFSPSGGDAAKYGHPYQAAGVKASDGSVAWSQTTTHDANAHYQVSFARDDRMYITGAGGFSLKIADGAFETSFGNGPLDCCAEPRATADYLFYGASYTEPHASPYRAAPTGFQRSYCDEGVFPGYGLIYTGPSGCGCYTFLNGIVVSSSEEPWPIVDDSKRLEKGSVTVSSTNLTYWPHPDEWPMYMRDPRRSSATTSALSSTLNLNWQHVVTRPTARVAEDWDLNDFWPGVVSAPVVADGKVFVSIPHLHEIRALDGNTGQIVWTYTTGAASETPPTIYDGLCLFGSRDGYVYCLRASDGKLVWRFLAALNRKKMMDCSSLESPWPVLGSVMIFNGKLYVVAGRHSNTDGGIQVYKMDPHTGTVLYHRGYSNDLITYPKGSWKGCCFNKLGRYADLLVSDGQRLHHFVDTLHEDYAAGDKPFIRETSGRVNGNPWISGAFHGLTSRRTESTGRFDQGGMSYGGYEAMKFAIDNDRLIRVAAGGYGRKQPSGLACMPLAADGSIDTPAVWSNTKVISPGTAWNNHYCPSVLVAGDKICVAGHTPKAATSFVRIASKADGRQISEITAVGGQIVEQGVAVAYGKLFISTYNGQVLCYGDGAPIEPVSVAYRGDMMTPARHARLIERPKPDGPLRFAAEPRTAAESLEAYADAQDNATANDRSLYRLSASGEPLFHLPLEPVRGSLLTEHWQDPTPDVVTAAMEGLTPKLLPHGFTRSNAGETTGEVAPASLAVTRGYFIPETTGEYRFAVEDAGQAAVYVSDCDDPARKQAVSGAGEEYGPSVYLAAGTRCYMETVIYSGESRFRHPRVLAGGPGLPAGPIPSAMLEPWHMGTGEVTRELWAGMDIHELSDLTESAYYPKSPTAVTVLPSVEVAPGSQHNFGERISGCLHPPVTGDYTFWISADLEAELRVGVTGEVVALAAAPVAYGDYDRYPEQGSQPVRLVGGREYYFEVRHVAAGRSGHCSAAWQVPGGAREVLGGQFVSRAGTRSSGSESLTDATR